MNSFWQNKADLKKVILPGTAAPGKTLPMTVTDGGRRWFTGTGMLTRHGSADPAGSVTCDGSE